MKQRNLIPAGLMMALFAATTIVGCAVSKNPLSGRSRAYAYSWQQEIQLGREADASIVSEYGVYDDPQLTAWVDSLGQALLAQSHLRRPDAEPEWQATEFTFRVLDSPVVNAFALPGGFVYVTRGLVVHAEDEAQLAVVIAHEIGHVAGRHASRRAVTQMLGQALLIGGAVGGQAIFGDQVASSILQLGSAATQLLFLSYSRDDERESDQLGVEYAAMAGYDASRGSAFFSTLRRLGEQSGQSLPGFMSTHPDPGEREETILRLAAEWEETYPMDRVGRDRLLRAVDGIVAGENPRQGFVQGGVFLHPDMAFQFPVPGRFEVVNQASRVVLVGPEQKALIFFGLESEASTARQAAEAFAATEGLTVIQSGVGSSYGLPAQFVVAEFAAGDGSITRIRAHYVDYQSRVFSFIGLAGQADYASWEPSFQQAMQGFAPLSDPAVLAIQPARIDLTRVSTSTRLSDLIPAEVLGGFTREGIAILNQRPLDALLTSGTTVKLVR
jgi:predicted Zn-dependent protease